MSKKGSKTKNLAGLLGEIDTQCEIWKTQLMMGWNNEMSGMLHHDITLFQENIGRPLIIMTALLDEETPIDEQDFPF